MEMHCADLGPTIGVQQTNNSSYSQLFVQRDAGYSIHNFVTFETHLAAQPEWIRSLLPNLNPSVDYPSLLWILQKFLHRWLPVRRQTHRYDDKKYSSRCPSFPEEDEGLSIFLHSQHARDGTRN